MKSATRIGFKDRLRAETNPGETEGMIWRIYVDPLENLFAGFVEVR